MLEEKFKSSIRATKSVEELFKVSKLCARLVAQADGATIVLREDNKCFYADEDAIAPLWKGQRFNLEMCISGWAMIHGRQACISNILEDNRIPQEAYAKTFVKSLVMTPMAKKDSMGAIGVYWSDNKEIDDLERYDLEELATLVGEKLKSLKAVE